MGQYHVIVFVREKPVVGIVTRLRLISGNTSERLRLESIVGQSVFGNAKFKYDRYVNPIRIFSRDEVEVGLEIDTEMKSEAALEATARAIVQYWGNVVEVFDKKIYPKSPVEDVLGKVDPRKIFAAFSGGFVIGAVLAVIIKVFRG